MSMIQPGTIIENKPLLEEVFRCISYNDVSALRAILETPDMMAGGG
jgi:hypothetical protein